MTKQLTIKQRVDNGAKFLDAVAPGWWREEIINLKELDLNNVQSCICGQVWPNPFRGAKKNRRSVTARAMGLAQKVRVGRVPGVGDFPWPSEVHGYNWAKNNLFTEGAKWIEATVDINGDGPSASEIARRLGFDSTTEFDIGDGARGRTASYAGLQTEWRYRIQERRRQANANAEADRVLADA